MSDTPKKKRLFAKTSGGGGDFEPFEDKRWYICELVDITPDNYIFNGKEIDKYKWHFKPIADTIKLIDGKPKLIKKSKYVGEEFKNRILYGSTGIGFGSSTMRGTLCHYIEEFEGIDDIEEHREVDVWENAEDFEVTKYLPDDETQKPVKVAVYVENNEGRGKSAGKIFSNVTKIMNLKKYIMKIRMKEELSEAEDNFDEE